MVPATTRQSRGQSDGLRPTKVGLYFLLLTAIVSLAALNTGNNGLFLSVALFLACVSVGHLWATLNVRGLEVAVDVEGEHFVNQASDFRLRIQHSGRMTRRLLVVSIDLLEMDAVSLRPKRPALLIALLPPNTERSFHLQGILRRRGRLRLDQIHISSLFPFGLFNKGIRYPVDASLLVYPEVFSGGEGRGGLAIGMGNESSRKAGWGHELHALRPYQPGDDPRAIHWKQSARQGELISQSRELEEKRRVLIVFDNAVGELETEEKRRNFETLISQAATMSLDFLGEDIEVGLQTRDFRLSFDRGPRQRRVLLEAFALLETQPVSATELVADVDPAERGSRNYQPPRQLLFKLSGAPGT